MDLKEFYMITKTGKRLLSVLTAAAIAAGTLPGLTFKKTHAVTSADLTISEAGVQFICDKEGFTSKCKVDGTQSSIGYGTRCTGSSVQPHAAGSHSITREQAFLDMTNQIETIFVPKVQRQTEGLEMTQNQFDALVSFCYNSGGGTTLVTQTPLVQYLMGNYSAAEAKIRYATFWTKYNGTPYQGLINRRISEADYFFAGTDFPEPDVVPEPVSVPDGQYYLVNAATGMYMSYAGNEACIYLRDADGSDAQKFQLSAEPDGSYEMHAVSDSKMLINCAVSKGSQITFGTKVTGRPDFNDSTQRYFLVPSENGRYLLADGYRRTYVIGASKTENDSPVIMEEYFAGQALQEWTLLPVGQTLPETEPTEELTESPTEAETEAATEPETETMEETEKRLPEFPSEAGLKDGSYCLENVGSGMVLQAADAEDGICSLLLGQNREAAEQIFQLQYQESGKYQILPEYLKRTGDDWFVSCKTTDEGSVAEGTKLQASPASDGELQQFYLVPTDSGTYLIIGGNGSLVIGAADTELESGIEMQAYSAESLRQQWRLIPYVSECILGDLDSNHVVNALDAALLLSAAANIGAGEPSGMCRAQEAASDLNQDGNIDSLDATVILGYASYSGTGGGGTFEIFAQGYRY